jgi:hypothetical protein
MPLCRKLEPLKLYSLGAGSLVAAELAAYETALGDLESRLKNALAQAFVQTATDEGLTRHELAAGMKPRPELDPARRRALVLYRKSVAPFDYNLSGMLNSIRAAGMHADIIQNYAEESLAIVSHGLIDTFLTIEDAKASLAKMLPAHLETVLDMGGITWEMLEQRVSDWGFWDSRDFTWEQFDIDMGNIFA